MQRRVIRVEIVGIEPALPFLGEMPLAKVNSTSVPYPAAGQIRLLSKNGREGAGYQPRHQQKVSYAVVHRAAPESLLVESSSGYEPKTVSVKLFGSRQEPAAGGTGHSGLRPDARRRLQPSRG